MVTVAINNHYKVVAIHEVAIGGRTNTAVAVKDLAKVAMLSGAHAIFMVHNHPSADPHPSNEDLAMTDAAKRHLKCLGIELIDHVIVGAEGHYSIVEGSLRAWT
jgi:DNA repair protein RadC